MIRIDDAERVRRITFDRPEALNAFNDALYRAAGEALRDADARGDIACIVLTGLGRAFSAGQDLAEMQQLAPSGDDRGGESARPRPDGPAGFSVFLDTLAALPLPVVCAVNGLGLGIGFTMLLHADLVFMARSARLKAPFTSLGVAPEAAGSVTMPRVMGQQAAAWALYTAEWITADQAKDWGIAFEVCDDDALLDRATKVARQIARMPIASLKETKQLVLAGRLDAIRAARAREDAAFQRLMAGPANIEALRAFIEKREPDFSGL
jgi:enoyl-CoA hydratase/carnithine racemase